MELNLKKYHIVRTVRNTKKHFSISNRISPDTNMKKKTRFHKTISGFFENVIFCSRMNHCAWKSICPSTINEKPKYYTVLTVPKSIQKITETGKGAIYCNTQIYMTDHSPVLASVLKKWRRSISNLSSNIPSYASCFLNYITFETSIVIWH